MKKVAATSGQRVSLASAFFALGSAWVGICAGSDKVLNFFLSSSLKDAHSRNLERGRHLQNTFSAHTRNKKMHARQKFFQQATVLSDSRWALLRPNDRRGCGAEAWESSFPVALLRRERECAKIAGLLRTYFFHWSRAYEISSGSFAFGGWPGEFHYRRAAVCDASAAGRGRLVRLPGGARPTGFVGWAIRRLHRVVQFAERR